MRFGISTTEAIVVGCAALLFLLEIGIKNGELNQVFYLLRGLRLANPSLLARDWYTVDSVPYHLWWNVVIGLLAKANLLVLGLTLGTVIISVVFTVSVYVVMKTMYAQPVLPWIVALMLFGGLFTRGLGDWDLLASSVEPFSTSGVMLVCGLAFLAKRQPLGAGVCLGFSAFLHPHFAILLTGVLLVSAIPLYLVEDRRFLALVVIPFVLLAAPTLAGLYVRLSARWKRGSSNLKHRRAATLFAVAGGGKAFYSLWVFSRLGYCRRCDSTAASATGVVHCAGIGPHHCRWLVGCVPPWAFDDFGTCTALATRLYRHAGRSFCRCRRAGSGWRRTSTGATALPWWVLAYAALVLSAVCGTTRMRWAVLVAGAVPIAVSWVRNLPSDATAHGFSMLPLAVLLVGMGPVALAEFRKSHVDIRPIEGTRSHVYSWVQSNTPVDSLWAVPLDWKDFRLNAQRAIVADWSATPFYPADVIEWHRRMRDLTGLPEIRTADQVNAAYEAMNCDRVDYLQKTYGVDYVVTASSNDMPCGVSVYQDDRFKVWRVRETPRSGAL